MVLAGKHIELKLKRYFGKLLIVDYVPVAQSDRASAF
jgi:hypothetical protein